MKLNKLVAKLLAVFLLGFFSLNSFAIITSPMSNYFDNTGTLIRKDSVFIKVKNTGASSVSSGSVMIWDLSADDGASVTIASNGELIGSQNVACVTAGTIAASAKGQCQVYGYNAGVKFAVNSPSVSVTAGSNLFLGSASGRAGALSTAVSADGSAPGGIAMYPRRIGTALDAGSTTGTVEAFINLL